MKKVAMFVENDFSAKGIQKLLVHDSPYFRIINFNFEAGQTLAVHHHDVEGELCMTVLSGSGDFLGADGAKTPLQAGDAAVCPIAEPHGFSARTPVRLLVTIAPTL
ncbi:MAG: cupin domain-containing protein [Thermodesulfobacteriota bacterium]